MQRTTLRPEGQLFVCTNVRAAGEALESGCGAAGPAVFDALKAAVLRSGRARALWVTRTGCLGHCPRQGCAVALYPANEQLVGVLAHEAPAVLALALARSGDAAEKK